MAYQSSRALPGVEQHATVVRVRRQRAEPEPIEPQRPGQRLRRGPHGVALAPGAHASKRNARSRASRLLGVTTMAPAASASTSSDCDIVEEVQAAPSVTSTAAWKQES